MGLKSLLPGQCLVDEGEESRGIHFHDGRGSAPAVGRAAGLGTQLNGGVRRDAQLDGLARTQIGQPAGLSPYPGCEVGIDNSHRGRLS